MAVAANVIQSWKGAVEPAETGVNGNVIQLWKGAVEPAGVSTSTIQGMDADLWWRRRRILRRHRMLMG